MKSLNGWVRLFQWRKFHWIEDGCSLCGKWGYFGQDPEAYDNDTTIKTDECMACRKKLNRILK